ncbi:MAG: hypothetical protein CL678_00660 [Bdellovibrionaceae bacterium]|nr:hypothetical protein [Pseudobdellovibrionaceae bacterium]
MSTSINTIHPPEVWTLIFEYLPIEDAVRCRLVCKCWRDVLRGVVLPLYSFEDGAVLSVLALEMLGISAVSSARRDVLMQRYGPEALFPFKGLGRLDVAGLRYCDDIERERFWKPWGVRMETLREIDLQFPPAPDHGTWIEADVLRMMYVCRNLQKCILNRFETEKREPDFPRPPETPEIAALPGPRERCIPKNLKELKLTAMMGNDYDWAINTWKWKGSKLAVLHLDGWTGSDQQWLELLQKLVALKTFTTKVCPDFGPLAYQALCQHQTLVKIIVNDESAQIPPNLLLGLAGSLPNLEEFKLKREPYWGIRAHEGMPNLTDSLVSATCSSAFQKLKVFAVGGYEFDLDTIINFVCMSPSLKTVSVCYLNTNRLEQILAYKCPSISFFSNFYI